MKRFLATLAAAAAALTPSLATAQETAPAPQSELRMLPSDLQYAYVRFETNKGNFLLELNNQLAPVSTSNFVQYVEDGFYDNTIFHRVIENFVIQGGGFTEDMTQKETRQPIRNEFRNGLKNTRGTISMARLGGRPNSATSQFFINNQDNAVLDVPRDGAGYAVFGKIIEGMDVIDSIRTVDTTVVQREVEQTNPRTGEVQTFTQDMRDVPVDPVIVKWAKRVSPESVADAVSKARETEAEAAKAEQERMAKISSMDAALGWLVEEKGVDPDSVVKHESGLWSIVATPGDGTATPGPTDRVTVHYTGWLTDGTKFDSSRDRGQPITFGLNQVIRGWTEGVGYMSPGETRYLIIPSELGYGVRGSPGSIPPNAALIFDVELIEIPG